MYLLNYQLHLLRKLSRGGNHIIQGSRKIGITTILINHALSYNSHNGGADVQYFTSSVNLARINKQTAIDFIYAAHTTRTSTFGKNLILKSQTNDSLKFVSGGSIDFKSINTHENYDIPLDQCNVIIIDNGALIPDNHLEDILKKGKNSPWLQIIIGINGGMKKNGFLYKLYLDSLRGLNNYEYSRLPIELATFRTKEELNRVYDSIGENQWNHDVELLNYSL